MASPDSQYTVSQFFFFPLIPKMLKQTEKINNRHLCAQLCQFKTWLSNMLNIEAKPISAIGFRDDKSLCARKMNLFASTPSNVHECLYCTFIKVKALNGLRIVLPDWRTQSSVRPVGRSAPTCLCVLLCFCARFCARKTLVNQAYKDKNNEKQLYC